MSYDYRVKKMMPCQNRVWGDMIKLFGPRPSPCCTRSQPCWDLQACHNISRIMSMLQEICVPCQKTNTAQNLVGPLRKHLQHSQLQLRLKAWRCGSSGSSHLYGERPSPPSEYFCARVARSYQEHVCYVFGLAIEVATASTHAPWMCQRQNIGFLSCASMCRSRQERVNLVYMPVIVTRNKTGFVGCSDIILTLPFAVSVIFPTFSKYLSLKISLQINRCYATYICASLLGDVATGSAAYSPTFPHRIRNHLALWHSSILNYFSCVVSSEKNMDQSM